MRCEGEESGEWMKRGECVERRESLGGAESALRSNSSSEIIRR